jgi:hypothetical protein
VCGTLISAANNASDKAYHTKVSKMTHIPYRTGIPTIKLLLERVCSLLVRYEDVIKLITPTEKYVYVEAIMQACKDFILNVPNPRPE